MAANSAISSKRRTSRVPQSPPPATVRSAKTSDLAGLDRLYRQLHLDDYDTYGVTLGAMRRAFDAVAKDRNHTLLVAEQGGEIVGTLHVLIFSHLGHGLKPMAIVENVVVEDRRRSHGIGEMMIKAAITIARRRGCYKLSLTTNVKRHRAHRFYERLGWRRSHHGYTLPLG